MAKCINIKHPDFKVLVEESGLSSLSLSAKMSVWMEKHNTNEWPTLEQLGITRPYIESISKEVDPVEQKEKFLKELKDNPNLTIEDIENNIRGWGNIFSQKKYKGRYTVLSSTQEYGFNKKKVADIFVRDVNRVKPGLLTLDEHPKYYYDEKTGNVLINKSGKPAIKGYWYSIYVNPDALSTAINTEDNTLTNEDVKQLALEFPEVVKDDLTSTPEEFNDIKYMELDPISREVNLKYREANSVEEFLTDARNEWTNPIILLTKLRTYHGLSSAHEDLYNILNERGFDLSKVKLHIINKSELNDYYPEGLHKHGNDYGFIDFKKRTNQMTICLVQDNLSLPGRSSFDLLANTMMHEMVHAITWQSIVHPETEAELRFSKDINNLYKLAKSKTKFKDSAAYKNVSDFVAEGLSNNMILNELKGMQYNWFQRFIRRIAEFFTGKTPSDTTSGIPFNYYDSLFKSVMSYTKNVYKAKPIFEDYQLSKTSDNFNPWIQGFTGKESLWDNAKILRAVLHQGRESYKKYNEKQGVNEEPFISTEESLNAMQLGGTQSNLELTRKDLESRILNVPVEVNGKIEHRDYANAAYKSIRKGIENYVGRVKLTDSAKEQLINRLEEKFGKDACIITNAFIYNIPQKVNDVVDIIVIHTHKGSPVYTAINFTETNGDVKNFDKVILPSKKKKTGMYLPMAQKMRNRIRMGFAMGTLRSHLGQYDDFERYCIPVNEDKNGLSTLEGNLIELKPTQLTSFMWADNFSETRAKAYDVASESEIDMSEAMEMWVTDLNAKIQDEKKLDNQLQKILIKVIKSLNKRATISKIYGNKLTVIEINDLMKDIITKHKEPMEALDAMIVYASKVLSSARDKLAETDLAGNKINKNTLTAYKNMLGSFEVLKDINQYMINTFGSDIGKGTKFRGELNAAIVDMGYIESEYRRRAIDLLTDYLAPYYNRFKVEKLDCYKRDYRLYQFRLKNGSKEKVPSHFDPKLTEEEYVAARYSTDSSSIADGTKLAIAAELEKGAKDIGYLQMLVDNILDTGDAVVGAFVKSLAILDDDIRKEVEDKRDTYLNTLNEFEKSLKDSNKVYTDYKDMYDFMLERNKEGKLTGHIITKFSSELLEERRQINMASEYYNDPKEAKQIRSAWLSENMPLDTEAYLNGFWDYCKELFTNGDINEQELKALGNSINADKKWIDISDLVKRKIISHSQGDKLYDWISKNQDNYRNPSEEWINPQWEKLSKILENPEDPRTKYIILLYKCKKMRMKKSHLVELLVLDYLV